MHTSLQLLLVVLSVIAALPTSINSNETQDGNVVNSIGSTDLQFTTVRFVWTINNFHFNDFTYRQKIRSPTFLSRFDDTICDWYLNFYPKGETSEDTMSIFLHSVSCDTRVNFSVGFINSNNEEINKLVRFMAFDTTNRSWGLPEFATQDFLINPENGLIVNGRLTIFCEVKININQQLVMSY